MAGAVTPYAVGGSAVLGAAIAGALAGAPSGPVSTATTGGNTVAGSMAVTGNVANVTTGGNTVSGSLALVRTMTGAATTGGNTVSGSMLVTDGPTSVVVTMPTSVDEIAADDLGAAFQGTGGHTHYGAAVYFDHDQYFWTTVNGVGVDPGVTGTAHEVALTGTAPFTPTQWATAADTVASAAGYTTSRTDGVLTVSGNSIDPDGAATAQAALVAFTARGGGTVLGALQEDAGSSIGSDTTGWIQVLPADVPTGAYRVIGIQLRRGSNVTDGVRVAVASGGTADGDPEAAVVNIDVTVGDSGANNWHTHWLDSDDVFAYSGSERLFIGTHGEDATSSIFGGSSVNTGTYQDGSTNLWLTDGTSGASTAFASPVGAVGSSFNFGISVRVIIQEAPYQTDGAYRVIGNAVPGVHDTNLFAGGTPVDSIFVSWRVQSPEIDGVSLMDTHCRLQAHAAGATNQIRFELWNPAGGATTMAGDTIVSTIGVTSDTQGTGWSSVQASAISVSSDTEYRFSIKGEPAGGEEDDTILDVWLGTDGADNTNLAGFPVYRAGVDIPDTEREVQAVPDTGTAETAIDFDPQVQTASPNPANGTVISPNNLSMIALYWGKAPPTVVAS